MKGSPNEAAVIVVDEEQGKQHVVNLEHNNADTVAVVVDSQAYGLVTDLLDRILIVFVVSA